MSGRRAPLMALLLLLGTGACSSMPSAMGAATDDDVVELRRRIRDLQLRTTMAEEEIHHLKGRIGELEGALAEARSAIEPAGAATAVAEPAPVPPEPLAARIEETNLDPEPSAAGGSLPVGRARDGGAESSAVTETAEPAARPVAGGPVAVSAAGQELYDRGYTLFHQGRYVDAESTFQRFLRSWPDTELSDNAWYWIGEARFARDDVSGALAAFSEVGRRYGASNKAPDALFKAGKCQERLGDVQGARSTYQEVLRLFPQTAASVGAREALDALR